MGHITPLKAIREKCIDCMEGFVREVPICPSKDCPLYPFRMGKNPNIHLTDEERERRAERGRQNAANLKRKES